MVTINWTQLFPLIFQVLEASRSSPQVWKLAIQIFKFNQSSLNLQVATIRTSFRTDHFAQVQFTFKSSNTETKLKLYKVTNWAPYLLMLTIILPNIDCLNPQKLKATNFKKAIEKFKNKEEVQPNQKASKNQKILHFHSVNVY